MTVWMGGPAVISAEVRGHSLRELVEVSEMPERVLLTSTLCDLLIRRSVIHRISWSRWRWVESQRDPCLTDPYWNRPNPISRTHQSKYPLSVNSVNDNCEEIRPLRHYINVLKYYMTFYQVLSDHSLTDFTDLHCNSTVNREYLTSIKESFILCKNNMSLPILLSICP